MTWREGMYVYLPDAAVVTEFIDHFKLGELVGIAEPPQAAPPPLYRDGERIKD